MAASYPDGNTTGIRKSTYRQLRPTSFPSSETTLMDRNCLTLVPVLVLVLDKAERSKDELVVSEQLRKLHAAFIECEDE
jgi:hypothetical protein